MRPKITIPLMHPRDFYWLRVAETPPRSQRPPLMNKIYDHFHHSYENEGGVIESTLELRFQRRSVRFDQCFSAIHPFFCSCLYKINPSRQVSNKWYPFSCNDSVGLFMQKSALWFNSYVASNSGVMRNTKPYYWNWYSLSMSDRITVSKDHKCRSNQPFV